MILYSIFYGSNPNVLKVGATMLESMGKSGWTAGREAILSVLRLQKYVRPSSSKQIKPLSVSETLALVKGGTLKLWMS